MTTNDDFDPYLTWLGIRSDGKLPDHYTLLGISRLEQSADKIVAAAERQWKAVHQHQTGPRGDSTQGILTQISAAKMCLLDREARTNYDISIEDASMKSIVRREEKKSLSPISVDDSRITPGAYRPTPVSSRSWFPIAAAFLIVVIGTTVWGIGRSMISDSTDNRQAYNRSKNNVAGNPISESASSEDHMATVTQSLDHILVLTSRTADLGSGSLRIESGTAAIAGWTTADTASWRMAVDDCRDGYFRAEIRYRSDGECVFELLDAQKVLASVSLPSSGGQIRSEEKFVRLTNNRVYLLTLKAKRIGLARNIEIFRVRLVPRK